MKKKSTRNNWSRIRRKSIIYNDVIFHNNIPVIPIKKYYNIYLMYIDENIYQDISKLKICIDNNEYPITIIDNKRIRLHSYIYKLNYDKPVNENVIDHINNKLDNRILNLRSVSRSVNSQNKTVNAKSSSKYLGVYKQKNKWRVQISFNNKTYSLG